MIEKCGIVVGGEFIELENIAKDKAVTFSIDPKHLIRDDIEAIWHTHPDGYPYLSAQDRIAQVASGVKWILVKDENLEVDCVPFLIGRSFEYGKADCGTIVEDSYMLAGLKLGLTERNDMIEDMNSGYILESLFNVGFYEIKQDEVQAGDVIVTTFNGSADHMMLYLGNEEILHHLYNRNSRVEFLHDHYRKKISHVLRHKNWGEGMIQAILNDIKAVQYG